MFPLVGAKDATRAPSAGDVIVNWHRFCASAERSTIEIDRIAARTSDTAGRMTLSSLADSLARPSLGGQRSIGNPEGMPGALCASFRRALTRRAISPLRTRGRSRRYSNGYRAEGIRHAVRCWRGACAGRRRRRKVLARGKIGLAPASVEQRCARPYECSMQRCAQLTPRVLR
jgi:hypothetical protein